MNSQDGLPAYSDTDGFTLIEVVVALAVTMIMIGSVFGLMASGQTTFRRETQVADMQMSTRSGLELLSRDLAMAGFRTPPAAAIIWADSGGTQPDENSDNILTGGGTGSDNASIWLVVWGPNTVHGIIPKGSQAGIQVDDLGEVTLEDASGGSNTGRMQAYRTHYRWDAGLSVRDWRYVVRIANIDKSALMRTYASGTFSTGAILPDLMYQAVRLVPNLSMGRPSFYMSRDIATWVSRQTAAMANASTITQDDVGGNGRFTERFQGIPMRRVDALAADEAALT